jgi:hypothetical protein
LFNPFCKKNVVCLLIKRPPNNLEVSKSNLKKKYYHVLVWVFLALVYFTLEFTHAHLMEPHSLTARPTQVSLCTCLCQKRFIVCSHKPCLVSHSFWKPCPKSSLNSPLLNLEAILVDDLSFVWI